MAHFFRLCENRYAELEKLEAVIATQDFLAFLRRRRHSEYRWRTDDLDERAQLQKCYTTMNESAQREIASSMMVVRKPSESPSARKRSAR